MNKTSVVAIIFIFKTFTGHCVLPPTQSLVSSQMQKVRMDFHKTQEKADAGDKDCQLLMGVFLLFSDGIDQDLSKAKFYLQQAAEQYDAQAQFLLGKMYVGGKGVKKDEAQALIWFNKAAEQGNAGARTALDMINMDKMSLLHEIDNPKELELFNPPHKISNILKSKKNAKNLGPFNPSHKNTFAQRLQECIRDHKTVE